MFHIAKRLHRGARTNLERQHQEGEDETHMAEDVRITSTGDLGQGSDDQGSNRTTRKKHSESVKWGGRDSPILLHSIESGQTGLTS